MTSNNMDWPGCHARVYCREAKTWRYCALPVSVEGYCTRHKPKSRLDRSAAALRATWKAAAKAVNGGVLRVKGMFV